MTVLLPSTDLDRAADALRRGHPVGMPTETVYGLAANALDPEAVARVFAAKERPSHDPLIVHISPSLVGPDPLQGLMDRGIIGALGEDARPPATLLTALWPGPLTLILPRGPRIPAAVSSGLDTVGVRMPAHPTAQALIDAADLPLVAPSANRFGRISPTTAAAVMTELGGRIPFVVDGGPCEIGVESTVLAVRQDGHTTLLRPGAITAEMLHAHLGVAPLAPTRSKGPQQAPGQLDSHYAPRTPLVLVDDFRGAPWDAIHQRANRLALLSWSPSPDHPDALCLCPDGDLSTAARRLFQCMRTLDETGAEMIVAERCPHLQGLGTAIRDRMQRASAETPALD